jgi:hypothetical protein
VRRLRKAIIMMWDLGKLNKKEIKQFLNEVTANVQNTQSEELEDINEI